MKKKFDPYTLSLLKQNTGVLALIVISVILIVILLPIKWFEYVENREKNSAIKSDIEKLLKRQQRLSIYSGQDMSDVVGALNLLIPPSEDYISVLAALERLQRRYGVVIKPLQNEFSLDQPEAAKLTTTVEGPAPDLIRFLSDYYYKGGRLITVDSVDINPANSRMSININFYVKKLTDTDISDSLIVDTKLIQNFKKVAAELRSIQEEAIREQSQLTTNYQGKTNPFN